MDDLRTMAIEGYAWREGYLDGLKQGLKLVQERARFGVDKAEKGIQEEIQKFEEQNAIESARNVK